jgi:hypothetical protein
MSGRMTTDEVRERQAKACSRCWHFHRKPGGQLMRQATLRTLRRIARAAANTYVGTHWPAMDTLRHNGIGIDFNEDRKHEAAIRRFLSTFSPEMVLFLLDEIIPEAPE